MYNVASMQKATVCCEVKAKGYIKVFFLQKEKKATNALREKATHYQKTVFTSKKAFKTAKS